MTAKVLQFPRPHPKQRIRELRMPGELASDRMFVTGTRTTDEALCARAYVLYLSGAPCWRHPACVSRIGHAGDCELPKAAEPDRDSGVFLIDGAQVVETEVEEA